MCRTNANGRKIRLKRYADGRMALGMVYFFFFCLTVLLVLHSRLSHILNAHVYSWTKYLFLVVYPILYTTTDTGLKAAPTYYTTQQDQNFDKKTSALVIHQLDPKDWTRFPLAFFFFITCNRWNSKLLIDLTIQFYKYIQSAGFQLGIHSSQLENFPMIFCS